MAFFRAAFVFVSCHDWDALPGRERPSCRGLTDELRLRFPSARIFSISGSCREIPPSSGAVMLESWYWMCGTWRLAVFAEVNEGTNRTCSALFFRDTSRTEVDLLSWTWLSVCRTWRLLLIAFSSCPYVAHHTRMHNVHPLEREHFCDSGLLTPLCMSLFFYCGNLDCILFHLAMLFLSLMTILLLVFHNICDHSFQLQEALRLFAVNLIGMMKRSIIRMEVGW